MAGKVQFLKEKAMDYTYHYDSPLGGITLASDGEALTGLWFDGQKYFGSTLLAEPEEKKLPVLIDTCHWLDLYFSGKEPDFTPAISLRGSSFRIAVWEILREIPRGETMTYGQIAETLARKTGKQVSARAVGGAVGHNPVSLIIPCHRVIGTDGSLTGYAGGTERKAALLRMEGYSGG